MSCAVVFSGGERLVFDDLSPEEMAAIIGSGKADPSGYVRVDRGTGAVFVNRDQVVFIRPLDQGET